MFVRYLLFGAAFFVVLSLNGTTVGFSAENGKKLTKQEIQFFEGKIRPVLVHRCYQCHSAKTNTEEGGLRVDTAAALLRGGSGGPAIVPGDPKKSLLIKAIEYQHKDFAMPPADAGGKLKDDQIRDFVRWVRMGAPDPREEKDIEPLEGVNEESKAWWAFQPVVRYAVPNQGGWAWNDLDRFIAAKQSELGLKPLGDAEPEALLRRLYFDLTGLPPTPEEQSEFVATLKSGTPRQQAIEKVVDKLLASDQFGVQWGRHWLDVARYAESSGREVNLPYNNAWRYRDFVIDAFNRDMPFDKFLISQIAGDQLEDSKDHASNLIATGFLAVGSKALNERNAKQFAVDQADEQIDAVFQATMAFTLACARCHDHKFDPVSQAEYTSVAGIFLSSETHFGVGGGPKSKNGSRAIDLPEDSHVALALEPMKPSEFKKAKRELEKMHAEIEKLAEEKFDDKKDRKQGVEDAKAKKGENQKKLRKLAIEASELEMKLEAYGLDGSPIPQAIGVLDKPIKEKELDSARKRLVKYSGGDRVSAFPQIDDSPLLARGDVDMPGKKIDRGVPHIFGDQSQYKIPNNKSGRLELAKWIASESNPMTSRVAVNRIWHWMMGKGIVTSVDNFGTTGDKPSHPELLDYMALQFQQRHWSVKSMVREIATSRVYQLTSVESEAEQANHEKDPDNRLLWKSNSRRLQAEEIRDAMIYATGLLDTKPQLASTLAKMNLPRIDRVPGRKRAKGEIFSDDVCRSIYLSVPRAAVPEVLELFDLPDANAVQGAREATNVPSQSLYLLNNQTVATQAGMVARAAIKKFPARGNEAFSQRLEYVYSLILCRHPNDEESQFARTLLSQSDNQDAGWISIVRSLFATAEFRYLD